MIERLVVLAYAALWTALGICVIRVFTYCDKPARYTSYNRSVLAGAACIMLLCTLFLFKGCGCQ